MTPSFAFMGGGAVALLERQDGYLESHYKGEAMLTRSKVNQSFHSMRGD